MAFKINQVFEGTYPPEVSGWCNNNRAYITEIESLNGTRRFQIVSIPEPTEEEKSQQLQAKYTSLIQSILDSEAHKLGYDNCLSVCSYVNTGVQKFDDEGIAFRTWRSAVWAKGYELLAEVQTGEREIPTEEELVKLLPKLTITYTYTE